MVRQDGAIFESQKDWDVARKLEVRAAFSLGGVGLWKIEHDLYHHQFLKAGNGQVVCEHFFMTSSKGVGFWAWCNKGRVNIRYGFVDIFSLKHLIRKLYWNCYWNEL